jgi:hypothetical protein
MKKFIVYIGLISITFFGFMACSKTGGGTPDDNHQIDDNDNTPPVITVNKPANNQVYVSGDSIIVEGFATDTKSLYKGKVKITGDANGLTMREEFYETHFLQRIDFRIAYKATVTAANDYTVTVEFEDHGLNTVSQTLKVKVNP